MKRARKFVRIAAGNWSRGCRQIALRVRLRQVSAQRFKAALAYRGASHSSRDAEFDGKARCGVDVAPFETVADAALRVLEGLVNREKALASDLASNRPRGDVRPDNGMHP